MRNAKGFTIAAALSLVIGLMCSSNAFSKPITFGGITPDKAYFTDYWGKSQEVQGTVDSIIFTQSKP